MHWADNCSQNTQNDSDNCEEVNIVLITENVEINNIFLAGTCISALIDTACTKAVARKIGLRIT